MKNANACPASPEPVEGSLSKEAKSKGLNWDLNQDKTGAVLIKQGIAPYFAKATKGWSAFAKAMADRWEWQGEVKKWEIIRAGA